MASIPPQIQKEFQIARQTKNDESVRREIEIAKRPGSGLRLAIPPIKDGQGKVVAYLIVVTSAPTCIVDGRVPKTAVTLNRYPAHYQ